MRRKKKKKEEEKRGLLNKYLIPVSNRPSYLGKDPFWVFESHSDCTELFPMYTFAINNVLFLALINAIANINFIAAFFYNLTELEVKKD